MATALCVSAEPNPLVWPSPQDMVGTQSCTAVSCHGGGGPWYRSGGLKGAEYVHWLGTGGMFSEGRRSYDPRARLIKSNGDPHALAAQRMEEPRFQEVLRKASGRMDGSVDAAMQQRCAKCHDPGHEMRSAERGMRNVEERPGDAAFGKYSGLNTQYSLASFPSSEPELIPPPRLVGVEPSSGIGCETCHGGARQWLMVHYQSGVTRDELLRLGMVDTKDLLVRARLCASCHVGSADQDMNHDMIAAGHPPLRFEQSSYEALLGRKHWDDRPARNVNPDYEVQLWAAGRRAAAAASLDLLEERSKGTEDREQGTENIVHKPWPEFAESNCLACHQPLRRNMAEPGARVSVEKVPRVPAWQTWNTALVELSFLPRSMTDTELPPPNGSWSDAMQKLRSAMEQAAEPDRHDVALFASQARMALIHQTTDDLSAITASSLLERIGDVDREATWDELCQYLAALAAARRALEDQGQLTVVDPSRIQPRIDRVGAALRFVAPNREWPVLFSGESSLSKTDVLRELARLRQDLLSEAHR